MFVDHAGDFRWRLALPWWLLAVAVLGLQPGFPAASLAVVAVLGAVALHLSTRRPDGQASGKAAAASEKASSSCSTAEPSEASWLGSEASERDSTSFSLVSSSSLPPHLSVPEGEDMRRLEKRVNAVNTVSETLTLDGVEVGGEAVSAFKEGAFPLALKALRAEVDDMLRTVVLRTDVEPLDDVMLSQWLIAKELNVQEAFKGIQGFASFRDMTGGGVLPSGPWLQQGMCSIPFEDRLGRPVIFVRARHHQPGNVEGFVRGVRSCIDVCMAHMLAKRRCEAQASKGLDAPNLLEQYVLVFDFAGASWNQVDYDAMHATFRVGTKEYPNRLGQIVALNVGGTWRICWKVARSVMHARTRRKTLIVAPHKVHKTMQQMVTSADMLPPCYGGTGPAWPEPKEFRSFEDQVGALAAATYLRSGVVPFGARPLACDLEPVEPLPMDWALHEDKHDTNDAGFFNWSFGCGCASQRAR